EEARKQEPHERSRSNHRSPRRWECRANHSDQMLTVSSCNRRASGSIRRAYRRACWAAGVLCVFTNAMAWLRYTTDVFQLWYSAWLYAPMAWSQRWLAYRASPRNAHTMPEWGAAAT